MIKYEGSVFNQRESLATGIAFVNATVTVRKTYTGEKAALFSDDGVTAIDNPVNSDSLGNYAFYIDSGEYNIVINEGLITEHTISNVLITNNNVTVETFAELSSASYPVNTVVKVLNYGDAYFLITPDTTTILAGDVRINNRNVAKIRFIDNLCKPEWFGAVGDGSTDDTQAIVNWASRIGDKACNLLKGKRYLCSSLVSSNLQIIFEAATYVKWNGSRLEFSETDTSNSTRIQIQDDTEMNGFYVYWRGSNYFDRAIATSGDNIKMVGTIIEAQSEQPSAAGSGETRDTTFKINGNNHEYDGISFKNIFWCMDGNPDNSVENVDIRNIIIDGYGSGVSVHGAISNLTIDGMTVRAINSNATPDPGRNAITSGGPNMVVRNVVVEDSGEHAIYLSASNVLGNVDTLRVSNINVLSSGQCGLKLRGWNDVVVSNCHMTDQHNASAAGPNEDGFRVELCTNVKMLNCSNGNGARGGNGGYYGIILDSCTDVRVNGFVADNIQDSIIKIEDNQSAGTNDNFHFMNIMSDSTSKPLMNIETTGAVGDIYMSGIHYVGTGNIVRVDAATPVSNVVVSGFYDTTAATINNVSGGASVTVNASI